MNNLHQPPGFSHVLRETGLPKKQYIGRFAPSPTGSLHAGSLVAAMASYLDARAHSGSWLVRMEDVDQTRTAPGAAQSILQTLKTFGMHPDGEVVWQSQRDDCYAAAFQKLSSQVYPCTCSRREIADSVAVASQSPLDIWPYPGTCRAGIASAKTIRAWRILVPQAGEPDDCIGFEDRTCGLVKQYLSCDTGDFVLRRGDGFWAYQLAVVVDDAAQGITDVVRGMDLLASTPRQIYLQRKLGLPSPRYLHVPLVLDASGKKLSKHGAAVALEHRHVNEQLQAAARVLGLTIASSDSLQNFWQEAIAKWSVLYLQQG